MNYHRYCVVLICLVFWGCQPFVLKQYIVKTESDEFSGNTKHFMEWNYVPGDGGTVYLNAQIINEGKARNIYLNILYAANDWFFIEEGNSLMFLINGEKLLLSTSGDIQRKVFSGYGINEIAWYKISLEDFKKLIFAEEVKFKLSGKHVYLNRMLNPTNKKRFAEFYNQYLN